MELDTLLPLPEHACLHAIDVNGVKIAVFDVNPPNAHTDVHLMHGFTGSKEDFWALASILGAKGFRVVAHDHRGQCQSSHADASSYSLEVLAQDAIAVARELDLRRPHALGHSFGGLVVREAAIQSPQTWSSITLFCTGPAAVIPMQENLHNTISILNGRTMAQAWQYFLDHADEEVPIRASDDDSSLYTRRWKSSDANSVLAQAQILLTAVDQVETLLSSELPVHVVYGELDDAWPIDEQNDMARRLNAPVSVIANAGHCPNEDVPELTADVLSKWWRTFSES